MQYYIISPDSLHYPQVKDFGGSILISDPNHLYHFNDRHTRIDFKKTKPKAPPHMDYFVLNSRLRKKGPSDLLSEQFGIKRGFLICTKLLNVLKKFKLQTHIVYPCKLFDGNTFYEYHYLFFHGHLGNNIDFKKSAILITKLEDSTFILDRVVFNNFNDYKTFFVQNKAKVGIEFEKLTLNSAFKMHDMFGTFVSHSSRSIYISQPLKDAFKKEKITNIRYVNLPENYITFCTEE